MTHHILEIKNLSFKYKDAQNNSLNKINLTVPQGACAVILGPNGAGKSTLMSLICGLLPPQEGTILFTSSQSKNHFSYGTQHCALYSELTVRENLSFSLNSCLQKKMLLWR
ncbi:MAG: ATP-binding cassette domain-containing protein [Bdellovibrionota bacterium]